ncbi:MAG: DUF4097 family beta strand repeat-containing protein [Cellulosilyticaceae bacterium]
MKLTSMKIGMIAVGMIVIGAGISLVAFLFGAKTNISFTNGEMILSDPFDREEEVAYNLSEQSSRKGVSNSGYTQIQETIESISKINIDVETLDVHIMSGENFAIDINYKDTTDVFYEVRGDKLTIRQEDSIDWGFFQREGRKGEAIIYLPREAFIEELDIDMGMGNSKVTGIQVDKLDLDCGMGSVDLVGVSLNKAYIEGGMGEISATDIVSNGLNVSMGMGSVNIQGEVRGLTDIEGGMGELKLTTVGKETDYNYDLSKGMGTISINGRSNNSFEDLRENNGSDNKITIEGGMGSITVNTEE